MIRLSRTNPITRLTRWMLNQKWLMKLVPAMFRYGGWLLMAIYRLFGMKVLLLTTTGRKSGKPRTTPAIYLNQDGAYFIAAISTATQRYPNWYHNLTADPKVTVELFWKRRAYRAEPVEAVDEKVALLGQFSLGLIEALQERPPEDIPLFRLRRTSDKTAASEILTS